MFPTTTTFQYPPVARRQIFPIAHHQPPPMTAYGQPSATTSSHPYRHQRHISDAHINLLRGLDSLPPHDLLRPASEAVKSRPQSFALGERQASRSDALADLLADMARELSALGPGRALLPEPIPNRAPAREPSPDPAPAQDPTPTGGSTTSPSSAPAGALAQARAATAATSAPALFASTLPAPNPFPPPGPTVFPTQSPSPDPIRRPRFGGQAPRHLPPHLRRRTPDPGSGSDEVVFGRNPSTSLSLKKQRRYRAHLPVHTNGGKVAEHHVTSESVVRIRAGANVKRAGKSLVRRARMVEDRGDVSSDGRDVVLFVPKSSIPPVPPLPSNLLPQQKPVPSPPLEVVAEPSARPVAPSLARKRSIPLPKSTSYTRPSTRAPPGTDAVFEGERGTEPVELPPKNSIELQKLIIEPPPPRSLARLPWSPLRQVLNRSELTSPEGSFYTALDTLVEDWVAGEDPSGIPGSIPGDKGARDVGTPAYMDLSELKAEINRIPPLPGVPSHLNGTFVSSLSSSESPPTALGSSANAPHSRPTDKPIQPPAVMTSGMNISEAIRHLVQRGCVDVTSTLVPVPEGPRGPIPLAGGRFGDVYKWANASGLSISVKCLRIHVLPDTSSKTVKRTTRELYYWSKAKHKNVLELLGVAEFNGQLAMVSPWMENGTLAQYLRLSPKTDRWDLCLQVGEGLAYLHGIGMVHGDIKAMNILVSNEGEVKISDFGNSILDDLSLEFTSTKSAGDGSLRWMAFELFDDTNTVNRSTMTDVHSLGMTILEVVTGRVPYCECQGDTQVIHALIRKKLPVRPVELFKNVKWGNERWELLVKCWDVEPSRRPTSQEVSDMMKELH